MIRSYQDRDEAAVLQLINSDRLPGQPMATAPMLAEALAGRSIIDSDSWAELEPPCTEVACTASGAIAGIVSYAARPVHTDGVLLWLHCGEDRAIAERLITHVLAQLHAATIYAFDFASALSLGLEGFPVRHRQATRQALEAAGFTGDDQWRYLHAALPLPSAPPRLATYNVGTEDSSSRRLEIRAGAELMAEAVIGEPVDGIGALWWISVEPPARGRGLGVALLGSALDLLHGLGAREVIAYVDDDAPPGDDRDRSAANRLYNRAGLVEVDRLFSFILRR